MGFLPEFYKDNPFIKKYYRVDIGWIDSFKSFCHIHNESLNIWSHFVGFFLILLTILGSLFQLSPHGIDYYLQPNHLSPIDDITNILQIYEDEFPDLTDHYNVFLQASIDISNIKQDDIYIDDYDEGDDIILLHPDQENILNHDNLSSLSLDKGTSMGTSTSLSSSSSSSLICSLNSYDNTDSDWLLRSIIHQICNNNELNNNPNSKDTQLKLNHDSVDQIKVPSKQSVYLSAWNNLIHILSNEIESNIAYFKQAILYSKSMTKDKALKNYQLYVHMYKLI